GAPVDTQLLLYLYNAGVLIRDPGLRIFIPVESKLSLKLLKEEITATKDKKICPFFKKQTNKKVLKNKKEVK
ncbi:hypothetical protein KAT51_07860, partial [bacterium]|nr:hypothetical protein [bacterium]